MIEMETTVPPPDPIIRGFMGFPTDPPQESILAGNAWLRRGDLAFLNSSAGAGKTVGMVQASIAWGLGLPYFGIAPARPLRILHFVGEDDDSTLGQCREGLIENARELFGRDLRPGEVESLDQMVRTDFSRQYIGNSFIARMDTLLTEEAADVVMVNPLLSFIGGEIVANASEFLRGGIMPVIQKHSAAALVAHHTPKLSRDGWENIDPTYSGTGGGEVANAPRAILTLMPTKAPAISVLRVSKRQTTGWKDGDDRFTDHAFFRRTDNPNRPAWLPVSHEEAAELMTDEEPSGKTRKATPQHVVELVKSGAMTRAAVVDSLRRDRKCSERPAKEAIAEARSLGMVDHFEQKQPGKAGKPVVWLCLPEHKSKWVE